MDWLRWTFGRCLSSQFGLQPGPGMFYEGMPTEIFIPASAATMILLLPSQA